MVEQFYIATRQFLIIQNAPVSIEYRHLSPTGRAYVKLTHSDFLQPSLDALESVTISGVHTIAEPSDRPPLAAQLEGNGLSSELDSNGRYVAVWGLPKAVGPETLDAILGGRFTFPPGEAYIFKMPQCAVCSSCSHLRLTSISSAPIQTTTSQWLLVFLCGSPPCQRRIV